MRGPLSTGRVLPTVAIPIPSLLHRCRNCGIDLCADLRVLGFTETLTQQIHGGGGMFHRLAHAELRCFRCELDFRSRY